MEYVKEKKSMQNSVNAIFLYMEKIDMFINAKKLLDSYKNNWGQPL